MLRSDFDFDLPPELIAQEPPPQRSDSRLLVLDPRAARPLADRRITDLPSLLAPGDLLVFNNTRVHPARLRGHKASGGQVELLVERLLSPTAALAQLRASKSPAPGATLRFPGGAQATVTGRDAALYRLEFDCPLAPLLEAHGEVPLPPYIRRAPTAADRERYQTVFARQVGSAAAPTAGLHFDEALLAAVAARGVYTAFVTLHVGAGTFAPVRSERVDEHRLHAEHARVDAGLCAAVNAARERGGRVVAVGTTTVRSLEAAAASGVLRPFDGDTRLFIRPGYRFRVVDAMVTNFHLPQSSLLMLVCAFAGRDATLGAYAHAVAQRYRFFSYGDAMLVWPSGTAGGHEAGRNDG